MKKKFLATVLCLMLSLTTIACSSNTKTASNEATQKPASNAKIQLTYWSFFGGGEGTYMQTIVDNFNKSQSNIVVKNVTQQWGTPYYTKLTTAVAAGKGPDVGAAHISMLPALVDTGTINPLDDYAKDINVNWSKFNKNILYSFYVLNGQPLFPINLPLEIRGTENESFYTNQSIFSLIAHNHFDRNILRNIPHLLTYGIEDLYEEEDILQKHCVELMFNMFIPNFQLYINPVIGNNGE